MTITAEKIKLLQEWLDSDEMKEYQHQLLDENLDLLCERMGALSKEEHDLINTKIRENNEKLNELGVEDTTSLREWTAITW